MLYSIFHMFQLLLFVFLRSWFMVNYRWQSVCNFTLVKLKFLHASGRKLSAVPINFDQKYSRILTIFGTTHRKNCAGELNFVCISENFWSKMIGLCITNGFLPDASKQSKHFYSFCLIQFFLKSKMPEIVRKNFFNQNRYHWNSCKDIQI